VRSFGRVRWRVCSALGEQSSIAYREIKSQVGVIQLALAWGMDSMGGNV